MAERSSVTELSLSKWQVAAAAAAVGVSVVGIGGYCYYRSRKPKGSKTTTSKIEKAESKTTKAAEVDSENLSPLQKAQAAKNKGNKYFKAGKYDNAIGCYTEAIAICPPEQRSEIATFYQNRAAAFEQLKRYDSVIDDCTKALEFNDRYVKAMFRRAKASEVTGKYTQCLEDVTAVCILESFQNQQSLLMADRILKEIGKTKATEAYKNRNPVEPSPQFFRTYFSAFADDPIMSNIDKYLSEEAESSPSDSNVKEKHVTGEEEEEEEEKGGDKDTPEKEKIEEMEKDQNRSKSTSFFCQALLKLKSKSYRNIIDLCGQELDDPSSEHHPEAQLLRATFRLLRGEGEKAMKDFTALLARDNLTERIESNGLIKRGSLRMQNGLQTDALDDFAAAVRVDPDNSDIYHHRGQLNLLIDRVEDAVRDFGHSVSLRPDFAIAHVQKCYTEYRLAFSRRSPMQMQTAIQEFEKTINNFPHCAEGYALYGQALCDQQMFDKADENFKKAIDIEPDNGNIYVHRGLLRLQWKQDIEEAAKLINQALSVDDKCEFAYETLGTIEIQRGNLPTAIDLFSKAISLAKTEVEMAHLYSLLDAAEAQSKVAARLGIQPPAMAPGMM